VGETDAEHDVAFRDRWLLIHGVAVFFWTDDTFPQVPPTTYMKRKVRFITQTRKRPQVAAGDCGPLHLKACVTRPRFI